VTSRPTARTKGGDPAGSAADLWTPVRLTRRSEETVVSLALGNARGGREEVRVVLPDALLAHGVESFASWAGLALRLEAKGDDPHHATEDAALVLGRALARSLGDRARRRVGAATVPMDDARSHVEVALDVGGRSYFALQGDLPPLVVHFLRSLADEARFTLHVDRRAGFDVHHGVEATFKALGLAFRQASEPLSHPRSRKGAVVWEEGAPW
jgi:imidazoleglycerol-phosphate dehydratase